MLRQSAFHYFYCFNGIKQLTKERDRGNVSKWHWLSLVYACYTPVLAVTMLDTPS